MSRDLMVQVIEDFGNEIGVKLEVDQDAYCCLGVDDNFQIHLKFNEHFDSLIAYSEMGEMPAIGQKEIFRHYVLKNGQIESNNLTFSYDKESNRIGISYFLPKDFLNLENFKKVLEIFITSVKAEQSEMASFAQGNLPKDRISFIDENQPAEKPAVGTENLSMFRM